VVSNYINCVFVFLIDDFDSCKGGSWCEKLLMVCSRAECFERKSIVFDTIREYSHDE
jgi:hypothetical protein